MRFLAIRILFRIVLKIQAYTSENGWMLEMLIFVFTIQCWLNKFWLFWYVWNHLCAFYLYWVPHTPLSFRWERQKLKWYSYENKCLKLTFLFFLSKNQQVKWGLDLQSEHERYITEVAFGGRPVIIRDYPKVCSVQFWVLILVLKQSNHTFSFSLGNQSFLYERKWWWEDSCCNGSVGSSGKHIVIDHI